ncbi:hypothetical protein FSP39_025017 [Pinctada imbricata]|uniref:Mab-21-like HhH/H2TH-like domain-containing protein n=1 Tax=Pinctada imbricata TaxID=66713 RepID=A0AA89BV69_PINIB|nr:hypothetical protein FSP39_025017 [Pinctada imbricata]
MKYHVTRPRIISTYHLKTIFLWTLEKYPPDTWTEENLGQRFLGLLDKLLHHISLRFLPQYFIPADNLFKNLNEDFVQIVVKVVSSMRQRPLDFIYRKNISPWNDEDTGMTIEEMLSWDDKPEEERYPGNNKLKDGCHDDSKHEDCRQGSKLEN